MIDSLKKIYIRLFTKNPYKVLPFSSLIKVNVGEPIHKPETLNSILIKEEGDLIFYPPYPESFDPENFHEKLNANKRYNTGKIYKEADRYLYSLDAGHIIGYLGLIYDKKSRSFIDESAKLWTSNLRRSNNINFYHPPIPQYLDGVTLSCITIGADGGFYHFLHEVLPKFYFCRKILPHVDHILINGPATTWKEKWLIHAGIDLNKIIWIDHTSHYHCKQLLFTNRLIDDQQISNWSINALKSLLNINLPGTPLKQKRIIWITRKNVFDRVIAWEDELLNLFPEIEKLDIRDLSVADTINTFDSATHVIGSHGAGLSNIFMCRQGTKILELYPDLSAYQPCYFRISSIGGLNHCVAEVDFNKKAGKEACARILTQFIRQ